MSTERLSKIVNGLLSQYNKVFNHGDVYLLQNRKRLPPTASPTLLDIEESFEKRDPYADPYTVPGSSGNENTE